MIQSREVKVLELLVGDMSLGLFKVTSEQEGLKKLVGLDSAEILIVLPSISDNGMANCFDNLFLGLVKAPILKDINVIAASPNLALKIKELLGDTNV